MAYQKTLWVDHSTPISDENLNHMEDGIEAAHEGIADLQAHTLKDTDIDQTLSLEGHVADAAAVGEQLGQLSGEIAGKEESLTDKFSFEDTKRIRWDTGIFQGSTSFTYLKANKNFVNIEGFKQLRVTIMTMEGSSVAGLAFYSAASESAYISGVETEGTGSQTGVEKTVNIPDDAKYVRTTYWSDTKAQEISAPEFSCVGIILGLEDCFDAINKCTEDVAALRAEASRYNIIDNLKNGTGDRIVVTSGSYGANDAKYLIPLSDDDVRCVVDFKVGKNVNIGDQTDEVIASITANSTQSVSLRSKKPINAFTGFSGYDSTYQQYLEYQSGFVFAGRSVQRFGVGTKAITGKKAFSLWIKGSYADDEPTSAELTARSEWLSEHQDLAIVCENDTLSLVRDGIGATGEAFNGGATSTLFSVSLKNGDNYKTLAALYQELEALQTAHDFVIRFYDLSARKTCADLLQFGKIKLVGRYRQQIDTATSTLGYYYDSYPVSFPFAIDESWHTLDMVKKGSTLWIAIDGNCFSTTLSGKVTSIALNGESILWRNLEVFRNGSLGDAEVFTPETALKNYIISERTPIIVALMGHDMITTYEGSDVIANAQQQSLTRTEDIILYAKEKGYSIVSLDEFRDMYTGRRKMPKRVALFILDDRRVAEAYQNLRNRAVVSKHGATLNFATIHSGYNSESVLDANFRLFTTMRNNGWCCASHSYRHDVRFGEKNSLVFVWELAQVQKDADRLNWMNDVIVANGSGGTGNQYECLENAGFAIAFHNDQYDANMSTNPYRITRTNIGDETSGTSPYSVLI